jgi:signal peptidase I
MAPAIEPGDRLWFDSHVGDPKRGEIVSYRVTFADGEPQEMVHRVVGLPGERLEPSPDGHLLVNGAPLVEDYLPAGIVTRLGEPVDVPADHFFMLGDNRDRSSDSRVTGPIPRADIVSRLTKVDEVKGDEEDPCGVAPTDPGPDPEDRPLTFNENDPPALQLLTLPVIISDAANEDVTADNLEAVRSTVRTHTDRLETLLKESGTPDSNPSHAILRDEMIPILRAMLAVESPDEWTARSLALDRTMSHYLQTIQTDALGD